MIRIHHLADLRDKLAKIENIDEKLAEADRIAAANPKRYTHDEIFAKLQARLS